MKVVLDTNFLAVPFQFKVDFFEEIPKLIDGKAEFAVLSSCSREINSIKKLADKKAAKSGLELVLKRGGTLQKDGNGKPDDEILKFAEKNKGNCVVATNDSELRRKLKDLGIKTVFLRNESYLRID